LPPDERLYTYQELQSAANPAGFLRPSAGCSRLTAELAALTHLADSESRARAARYALMQRPRFLTAGQESWATGSHAPLLRFATWKASWQ
jgi:hypothetical protein